MILTATSEIVFAAATPVAIVLMLHPRSGPGQWMKVSVAEAEGTGMEGRRPLVASGAANGGQALRP